MGIPLTNPFGDHNESMIVKSISLGDDQVKTAERSVSFNGRDSDPKILKYLGSGRMAVEGSVRSDVMDNAAVKLQKVYKSFRTRRKLADCAVLVEQNWWEVIDFAELRHSSISFFDMEHHESAISRWSRAKTRAAKVGKGLSKNDKAQKLALQHWLEAIDPRHRYGHNLHFYYDKWFRSQSREPFFYWLDIGEGKEMNLEKCPRTKLLQQCIKYLGPIERLAYEVGVENGKLFFKQSGELLDTTTEPHSKWIFVLSTSKALYVGKKTKGTFQHSSFLAGGATSAAGRLVVENGDLKAVWPHSGHYRPTPENFQDFISFLRENNVDLSDVKMDPTDDDEEAFSKQRSSHHLRSNSSEEDFVQQIQPEKVSTEENAFASVHKVKPSPRMSKLIPSAQLTRLVIPRSADLVNKMKHENTSARVKLYTRQVESPRRKTSQGAGLDIGTENSESHQLDVSDDEEDSILKRINSHKEMKSYQLGKQLTCKWTSGTGPRISCVRDYPTELQFRALEQVNLSPRSLAQLKCTSSLQCGFNLSPKVPTPKTIFSEASVLPYRTRSSPLFEMTEVS